MEIGKKLKDLLKRPVMNSSPFDIAEQMYKKRNLDQIETPNFNRNSESVNLSPFDKAEKLYANKMPEEGENDLEREIERNIAQGTSRMGEAALGAPGDLMSLIKNYITYLPIGGILGELAPTSSKLREVSEKATGGYTKPKTEFEEKGGEILQDITSMLMPGSANYSMLRNIGIPIVANLAKEGAKEYGADKFGDASKIGLMVGLDLIANRQGMGGGAKKYASGLFSQMEKEVPKGVSIKAENLEKYLNAVEKEMSLGGSKPSTEKALAKLNEIKGKVKNGKISLEELVKTRPAINEIIDDLGGFEYMFKPKIKERIINNMQKVKGAVIKATDEYGEKFNPKFLKLSRSANEAYAAYENSNRIGQFLNKHFGSKALGNGVKSLLGIGAPGLGTAMIGAKATAIGGVPLTGAYQGYKIFKRMQDSPTLRKYYGNILKGSIAGNVESVSRDLKALDQALKEDENQ